jgi:hypothetical protein
VPGGVHGLRSSRSTAQLLVTAAARFKVPVHTSQLDGSLRSTSTVNWPGTPTSIPKRRSLCRLI